MTKSILRRAAVWLFGVALCAATVGCGPGYQIAEVEGVITVNKKPGAKIAVEFYPDPNKGTKGPMSVATTDAQGRFRLELSDPKAAAAPGAVVGWHRVVLRDLQLAESETGKGVPIRLGADYALVGTTPLAREVTAGKQSIEIDLPGK